MILRLKANSEEEMLGAIEPLLLTDEEGHLVIATHEYFINLIGKKYEPTGKTLIDGEGNEYSERLEIEGYHAELTIKSLDGYEPLKSLTVNTEVFKEREIKTAKKERDEGRHSPIEVQGLVFDADAVAYENIKGTVDNWETLVNDEGLQAIGLVDGYDMFWTLADNSVAKVNKELLQEVLGAVTVRAGLLHANYIGAKS